MNAATEFDVGPLTWVKSEIDLALERAAEALKQFSGGGDATQLKFARTHLHQVRGALAIVGLDGVTQFVDSLEGLIDDFEQQKVAPEAERIALVQRALAAVHHYLDDLVGGEPNQPLRLMPVYGEILAARGQSRASATDLFFPDLSLRPPRRAAAPTLSRDELQQLLRTQRARFQRGLLAWLRNPADRGGVAEMLDATRQVEATQELAAARAFWWVASGMLTALAEGRLPAEVDIKQLCARIDLQIRRLIEGSKNVAERLMRDALYYVAQADSSDELVRQVKDTYQLQSLVPTPEAAAAAPQETLRRRLRETIAATEEAWNKFCAGTAQSLPVFRDHAATVQQAIEQLGHTDYRRLAQAIANTASWLAEKPSRHSDALAMEVATAILLAQNAQENFTRLGADFAHQVDVMVARLHGFLADNPPEPGSEVPLLDEMSRQAQEKLLIGQVAKEIQSNLAQIEQVLDGFFRDAEKRGDLVGLEGPLHQIVGALLIMGQNAAVDTLHECEGEIRRFAAADYVPDEADFERVADKLSALGFFIDSMQHGASDFAEFQRTMTAEPAVEDEETGEGSVEAELEQAKRETQVLLQAFKEQPADENLRQELKQNLETLKQDADLVADSALGQQAKAALSALNAGTAPAIDEALAGLRPQTAEAPTPSAETLQLAQADEDELDAELLSIFIEEAKEVLEAIDVNLGLLREQPHNAEVLTNIRRSFHTLKGSGRMVGLRDLGEVAWSIEQVLNLWLRQELELTLPVFEMVSEGQRVFSAWVLHLEERAQPLPDARALVALAESLRVGGEAPTAAPAPAGEVVAEPVVEAPAAEAPATPETEAAADDMYDSAATTVILGNVDAEETAVPDVIEETIEMPPLDFGSESEFNLGDELPLPDGGAESPATPATAEPVAEFLPESVANVVHADFGRREPPPAAAVSPESVESVESTLPSEADLGVDGDGEATIELGGLDAAFADVDETAGVPPSDAASDASDATPAPAIAERGAALGISATLYDIFLEEARTHIATLNREFDSFAADPGQPTPYAMARAAHTLAGISGTVGIAVINRLGATLEHALLRRETTDHPDSASGVEVVRQTIAALAAMIDSVAEERMPEPQPQLVDALETLYPPPAALVAGDAPPVETAAAAGDEFAPEIAAARAPGAGIIADLPAVKDELDEQLLPIFLEEAAELIVGINEQLRNWRSNPGDAEALHALHRLFHTLKGSARMAGAMTLGEITHAIESRVEQADKAGSAPHELIDDVETAF
ncbi:MAG TPA: Hpt domain-containing protein, partial [Azospira sp.]|nr:Hpt domain-containing protein [Azospira sp.]